MYVRSGSSRLFKKGHETLVTKHIVYKFICVKYFFEHFLTSSSFSSNWPKTAAYWSMINLKRTLLASMRLEMSAVLAGIGRPIGSRYSQMICTPASRVFVTSSSILDEVVDSGSSNGCLCRPLHGCELSRRASISGYLLRDFHTCDAVLRVQGHLARKIQWTRPGTRSGSACSHQAR